jgi:non-ribosomal peptide synthetase component F
VLDRMQVWEGRKDAPVKLVEVEEWVAAASALYGGAACRFDVWQALGMVERLRSRGVRCEEFSFSSQSVGRLGATLHLLIRNRLLALPDDEALIDELAAVRLRETSPGVVRMDHAAGQHDDRAIAVALAASRLIEDGAPSGWEGPTPTGQPSELLAAMFPSASLLAADGRLTDIRYGQGF